MEPLAIASLGLGVLQSATGLFDNSAQQNADAANKARVAEIDRQNQQTHFKNLGIRAASLRNRTRALEQVDNINTAAAQKRAAEQLTLDRAVSDSLVENQADAVKMFRGMTGNRTGRVNLDASSLAEIGRAGALRRNALMRGRDNLVTSGYLDRFQQQNAISQSLATAAVPTIYQQYIQDYTPTVAANDTASKLMNFGLGAAGSYINALKINRELKPPTGNRQINPLNLRTVKQAIPTAD
jgi:hypothetical protein